ncbi:hypothetical protein OEZ85_000005 [Tetradesmus obliquus]|uniref:Uncharacterized protein n=1 Tax=Tetradesmus obliquus TaxID=3088 RepID=A0ABY8UPP1_TETOB|nr:hypothetical protein OEZ85_000005 [Tetradesmus obliquus]
MIVQGFTTILIQNHQQRSLRQAIKSPEPTPCSLPTPSICQPATHSTTCQVIAFLEQQQAKPRSRPSPAASYDVKAYLNQLQQAIQE